MKIGPAVMTDSGSCDVCLSKNRGIPYYIDILHQYHCTIHAKHAASLFGAWRRLRLTSTSFGFQFTDAEQVALDRRFPTRRRIYMVHISTSIVRSVSF